MSNTLALRVCPEHARELILEWLIPLTENGTMDELFKAFVNELQPYAVQAANKVLQRQLMTKSPEMILEKLRPFLGQLLETLQGSMMNPDMMAVAFENEKELLEAAIGLRDWIQFLDRRSAGDQKEAIVAPSAADLAAKGGVA